MRHIGYGLLALSACVVASSLHADRKDMGKAQQAAAKVDALLQRGKDLEKELAAAKQALVTGQGADHDRRIRENQ